MKKKLVLDVVRNRGFLFTPCSKVLAAFIAVSFCLHTGALLNLCAEPVAQAAEGTLFCRVVEAINSKAEIQSQGGS